MIAAGLKGSVYVGERERERVCECVSERESERMYVRWGWRG